MVSRALHCLYGHILIIYLGRRGEGQWPERPMERLGETIDFWVESSYKIASRLTENAHLPFDKLMALSRVEGLFYPHPPPCFSLRETAKPI